MIGQFPELAGIVATPDSLVLDGEIVILNEAGVPDFGLLQNRRGTRIPAAFMAFDLLRVGDTMLLDEPYVRRRELLEQLAPADPERFAVPAAVRQVERAASGVVHEGPARHRARAPYRGPGGLCTGGH
ncbi:hypothetical protein H5411_45535 [Amycolatopsis echigonensis]|uniref:ATP-dependent DNA ligase family profile domain-containing protein n=2 Tax=Amycolatopsis echigonensis TaxID=2576905 RepID=A0A8E2B8Y6_9PSEU|nr:hypothetical protein [Amycolatopsis echigonensis]